MRTLLLPQEDVPDIIVWLSAEQGCKPGVPGRPWAVLDLSPEGRPGVWAVRLGSAHADWRVPVTRLLLVRSQVIEWVVSRLMTTFKRQCVSTDVWSHTGVGW